MSRLVEFRRQRKKYPVVVTGDIFRPCYDNPTAPSQMENIVWMNKSLTGLLPLFETIYPSEVKSMEEWIRTDAPDTLVEYPEHIFSKCVIGFELPVNLMYQLKLRRVPFIDVQFYPIRFLKKRLLGLYSNLKIPPNVVYREGYQKEADFFIKPGLEAEMKDILLIIGQSPYDRSLFRDGEYIQLPDYMEDIKKLANSLKLKPYFRPHPWTPNNFVSEFEKEGIPINIGGLVYEMLHAVGAVCGVSSSTLYEARYFNVRNNITMFKERQFLGTTLIDYIPVQEDVFFSPYFWSQLSSYNRLDLV